MTRKATTFFALLLAASLPALLTCSNGYNPFEDASNARARIVGRTFPTAGEGTVEIFSAETLSLVIALAEKVDSVIIAVPGNRFGDTSIIRVDRGTSAADGIHDVAFSLCDTGRLCITITTVRSRGESVTDRLWLRAISPLLQAPVAGSFGQAVHLSTDSVLDEDVLYHWSFSAGIAIASAFPALDTVVSVDEAGGLGRLWVSDLRNEHQSPAQLFSFSLGDTLPPVITVLNQHGLRGDTLRTGDSVFVFTVRITDPGYGLVRSAAVNGLPFDDVSADVYTKILYSVNTQPPGSARPLAVTAADRFGNAASVRFLLVYDSTIARIPTLALSILAPSRDSLVTSARQQLIMGELKDYAHDSLNVTLTVTVNGAASGAGRIVAGKYRALWENEAYLSEIVNTIAVSAVDNLHGARIDTTLVMFYNPDNPDVTAPALIDITVNGAPARAMMYAADTGAQIRIIAFDAGSGIDRITINGAVVPPDSEKYVWRYYLPLVHVLAGNALTVAAVDKEGNDTTASFIVYRNRSPAPLKGFSSRIVVAGRPWRDTLTAFDADGDPVTMRMAAGPSGSAIANGIVTWTPPLTARGDSVFLFELDDGYPPVAWPCTLTIRSPENAPCSLSVSSMHGILHGDTVLLQNPAFADTLHFAISDADLAGADRYAVTIAHGAAQVMKTLATPDTFAVAVEWPATALQTEILAVRIEDLAGHVDSIGLIIVYRDTTTAQYSRRIVFCTTGAGASVSTPVVNIPIAVRFDSTNFDFSRASQTGGFRCTNKDGKVLPYQIELWDPVGKKGVVWVRVDTVYANCDTQSIIITWQRGGFAAVSSGPAVFEIANGFAGVWHLNETSTVQGAAGIYKDATANANNGTNYISNSAAAGGVAGAGCYFDAVNDYIDVPASGTLNMGGKSVSISIWVKSSVMNFSNERLFFEHDFWPSDNNLPVGIYQLTAINGTTSRWNFGGAQTAVDAIVNIADGAWHQIASTYDTQSRTGRVYVDGVLRSTGNQPGPIGSSIQPCYIGARGGMEGFWGGYLDELQVSATNRSAAWIKLSYENQRQGSTFISVVDP